MMMIVGAADSPCLYVSSYHLVFCKSSKCAVYLWSSSYCHCWTLGYLESILMPNWIRDNNLTAVTVVWGAADSRRCSSHRDEKTIIALFLYHTTTMGDNNATRNHYI